MGIKDPRHISVREIISIIHLSGDLETESFSNRRAVEGTKGHKAVQQSRNAEYQKEVKITGEFKSENLTLIVEGRMDGLIPISESRTTALIEEIKTVNDLFPQNWEDSPAEHKLQLLSYAYLYCMENSYSEIEVQLTYYNLSHKKEKSFTRLITIDEASEVMLGLIESYLFIWQESVERNLRRNISIKTTPFPYENFRGPQRDMSVAVFRAIREKQKLLLEAPTGTGKTMGALFPALKSLGENTGDRIFYITARTPGRLAAEEAFRELLIKGLQCRAVSITAKQKICFFPGTKCSASECSYAEAYYSKLPNALEDLEESALYEQDSIEKLARKHKLCPFELSLDISLVTDLIICDYNYVFDPLVKLKRYFMKPVEEYILLADEAHNLPDRSRDMFSASMDKDQILSVRREIKEEFPLIAKSLNKINQILLNELKVLKEENKEWNEEKKLPETLRKAVGNFLEEAGSKETNQLILDLSFELRRFYKISELADKEHTFLQKRKGHNGLKISTLNLDPSKLLDESFKQFRSTILFSATLNPFAYFQRILFIEKDVPFISLPSPFPEKNCSVYIRTDIETRYNKRKDSILPLCRSIYETLSVKEGNYIVFFPSYTYMNQVKEHFEELYPGQKIHIQESGMNEDQRTEYLERFTDQKDSNILAFAVMGGIFGEGIDLKGEKLIGVIIIGPGLPGISVERDLYKKYYENNGEKGFDYAYKLPGFNKVLQAAGRVIRSEDDKGLILLIDSRYGWNENRRLYPPYWKNIHYCNNSEQMKHKIKIFWEGN
ncbi:MAG: ATP-dependent DNA helicase [Spirochaetaceae bacterium]|jgi:DNA excision repair protein ERCC-2|nr:ATP-dependent DNA helicase [Spirochaetaceae bacterium]